MFVPLAVTHLKASPLPTRVTLGDAQVMSPSLRLSSFARVEIVARISKSGDAMPQAGDLESAPVKIDTRSNAPIAVTIDKAD